MTEPAHRRFDIEPPVLDVTMLVGTTWVGEIILVRHAQQRMNYADPSRPRAGDAPLSPLGRRQAATVVEALMTERLDAVYSSDLRRAIETAELIVANRDVGVTVDARLREVAIYRDIPPGQTVLDVLGVDGLADLRRRFGLTRRWDEFPCSESTAAFRARIDDALANITAAHPPSSRIAVVCHAGVINTLACTILGLAADACSFPPHASITRVGRGDGRLVLRSLSETGHLRPFGDDSLVTY